MKNLSYENNIFILKTQIIQSFFWGGGGCWWGLSTSHQNLFRMKLNRPQTVSPTEKGGLKGNASVFLRVTGQPEVLRGFPQYLQANTEIEIPIRHEDFLPHVYISFSRWMLRIYRILTMEFDSLALYVILLGPRLLSKRRV
jgi:hypothetical protein